MGRVANAWYVSGPAVRQLITDFEVVGLGVDSPLFSSRRKAERWLAARIAALPAGARPGMRACLCCRSDFMSDGWPHRLCKGCRDQDGGPLYSRAAIPAWRLRSLG